MFGRIDLFPSSGGKGIGRTYSGEPVERASFG